MFFSFRSLACFEDGDFLSLRHELCPSSDQSDGTATVETKKPEIAWNLKDIIMATQKNYMNGVTLCETAGDWKKEMYVVND